MAETPSCDYCDGSAIVRVACHYADDCGADHWLCGQHFTKRDREYVTAEWKERGGYWSAT